MCLPRLSQIAICGHNMTRASKIGYLTRLLGAERENPTTLGRCPDRGSVFYHHRYWSPATKSAAVKVGSRFPLLQDSSIQLSIILCSCASNTISSERKTCFIILRHD